MQETTNYKLKKIELTDSPPDITIHSRNFDIIDAELKRQDKEAKLHKADTMQQLKTYIELKNMVQNNKLVPGTQYVLTDYRTKYKQPGTNTIKKMSTERLVLTATDTNKFDIVCSSLDYPQDIIYYDFNDNVCENNSTSRNGFILRRIDESKDVKIDCPQDWRTMVWARWTPDDTQYYKNSTSTNYSVWTGGNAELGKLYRSGTALYIAKNTNVPSSRTDSNVFFKIYDDINVGLLTKDKTKIADKIELKKGALKEVKTFGSNCYDIKIDSIAKKLHNNVFYDYCYSNTFASHCFDNTFASHCYSNTFASYCYNNTFASHCFDNTFASSCFDNTFASSCYNNIFASHCYNNTFASYCYNNTFASSCYNNIFASHCYNNTFASYCYNNTFASSCYNNTFASHCYNNTFASYCSRNNVKYLYGKNLSNISFLQSKKYTINFEKNSNNDFVYWYLDSSNTPVYTVIP